MENQEFVNPELNNEKKKRKAAFKSVLAYLHDFVTWFVVIVLVFLLLFRVAVVSGPSMKPTLVNGDYLLLLSNTFYRDPKQGDIVVASKESFHNGEPIIKRVIATEGQEVDIDFEEGVVYVDDEPLDEPYTLSPTYLEEGVRFPLIVEDNCVFVMGDNRNNSKDSRNPEIGQVDCREILGKVLLLMIPGTDEETRKKDWSRMGAVD